MFMREIYAHSFCVFTVCVYCTTKSPGEGKDGRLESAHWAKAGQKVSYFYIQKISVYPEQVIIPSLLHMYHACILEVDVV